MNIELAKNLMEIASRASNASSVYKLDQERAETFKTLLRLSAGSGRTADLGATLRVLLLADQELFEEVAYIQDKNVKADHNRFWTKAYARFSKAGVDGQTAFQRASEITSTAGNGNNDFSTLFVESIIKKRVESESELLQMLDQKRLTTTKGKFPKSSNTAKAAFATVSADLTDLTDTIDDGFGHLDVEAQKFGGTMFLEAETFVKLDAQTVSQILDELTIAYRRGKIDQIVNGNGSTPNATGLAKDATAVTFNGNVTQTLLKMIAAVADVTRGGMKDIFILTNTAGKTALLSERFINPAYDNILEGVIAGMNGQEFIKSLPIVEENVIVTSGTSPNKTAPLYVGKKGDYLVADQTDPQIMIDPYSDFKAGGETVRIMNFWTGSPYFADSFAKTTIPTVY